MGGGGAATALQPCGSNIVMSVVPLPGVLLHLLVDVVQSLQVGLLLHQPGQPFNIVHQLNGWRQQGIRLRLLKSYRY